MPYWSNGQDIGLPNRSSGFDSPVRLSRAASSIGRAPGSYPGLWGIVALAAHAIRGSRATGRRGGFKYRTVRVRIPPPLLALWIRCPFV